jgi:hypothetical protein
MPGSEAAHAGVGSPGRASQPEHSQEWPTDRSLPRARPDLSFVPLDDNVAIYDEVGQVLVMLNSSAAAVLERCDGTTTFELLVAGLAVDHAADPQVIRRDTWLTLRKFASMGLVADAH